MGYGDTLCILGGGVSGTMVIPGGLRLSGSGQFRGFRFLELLSSALFRLSLMGG